MAHLFPFIYYLQNYCFDFILYFDNTFWKTLISKCHLDLVCLLWYPHTALMNFIPQFFNSFYQYFITYSSFQQFRNHYNCLNSFWLYYFIFKFIHHFYYLHFLSIIGYFIVTISFFVNSQGMKATC